MNDKLYKLPLLKLTISKMLFTKSVSGENISNGPTHIKRVPIP
jgi:hypothetical protein